MSSHSLSTAALRGIAVVCVALIVVGLGLRPGSALACVGDCNGDGTVTVNELVTVVNIALGLAPLSTCTAIDANGDGMVTINELVAAVNNALGHCPDLVPAQWGSFRWGVDRWTSR